MTDETLEQRMRTILEADPHLSVAEARARAEGRTYNPTRDHSTFDKSVSEIRRALVREFNHNVDVGEVLVAAVTAAQHDLDDKHGNKYLTDNRPGSWEAALLYNILQSGGS